MPSDAVNLFGDLRHGLIWGFDWGPLGTTPVENPQAARPDDRPFRWLHFNLTDRRADRCIADLFALPPPAHELLMSPEDHQRALVVDGYVCGALSDFVHDFARDDTADTDVLRFVLGPSLMITARVHPLHSADLIRQRIDAGEPIGNAAQALDLLTSSVLQVTNRAAEDIARQLERIEDALLDTNREPATGEIAQIRRRTVQLDRQVTGLRAVVRRLERDSGLPATLEPTLTELVQVSSALYGDIAAIQQQARLLREELDVRTAQRTNQNLYILSVMTALLLPATLVTGIFGMNTADLPLQSMVGGTYYALGLCLGAALITLFFLRALGFFRR
jgi:Mg2+ and Co2+ transporter CorA